jgi:DNA polymerase-3 subunit gamma/tau
VVEDGMAYQVLARKWRPKNFTEVVGQEHVLKALINALDNNRLHHAYLFTGTRGVGKTTLGRILTKSLNCETGVTSKPCGICSTCVEIDEGRFVDLLEVDAASRTKVEDTRDLLDNVQYSPTRGRYKVYLIDEVHMLSNHSFNALLKTLEEPPPHVKFILATTDPQKLPVTILSRCLKFNLKVIAVEQIVSHLENVLTAEQIAFDIGALKEIARSAGGSMRDALSLLDQAIAHGGGRVSDSEVRAMLGTIDRDQVVALLRALARSDGSAILSLVHGLAQMGYDFNAALAELVSLLHAVALAQIVPNAENDSAAVELAAQLSPEDVQLYYQIGLQGRKDLPLAPEARAGFEMILLRMLAFRPGEIKASVGAPASAPVTPPPSRTRDVDSGARTPVPSATAPKQPPSNDIPGGADVFSVNNNAEWADLVKALPVSGIVRQIAVNCVFIGRQGDVIQLQIDNSNAQFAAKNMVDRLQQAVQQAIGKSVRLELKQGKITEDTPATLEAKAKQTRLANAVAQIEADPTVKALKQTFDAQLDPRSVQLVE